MQLTVDELLKQLLELKKQNKENGKLEVFVDGDGEPFAATKIEVETAGKDWYPESYNMPEGFTYLMIKT